MAMGIVSDKDFHKEISNTNPSAKKLEKKDEAKPIVPLADIGEVIDIPTAGRRDGDVNVPNSLRQIIGESSLSDGRQESVELARQFGISPSSVSAYAKGATSTASYNETPNQSIIAKSRIRVQKRATNRLMQALAEITPEKLAVTKARDLAAIAKDMSAVVKTMEPESDAPDKASSLPQFLVYAPQFRDERSFEVIYAKE